MRYALLRVSAADWFLALPAASNHAWLADFVCACSLAMPLRLARIFSIYYWYFSCVAFPELVPALPCPGFCLGVVSVTPLTACSRVVEFRVLDFRRV